MTGAKSRCIGGEPAEELFHLQIRGVLRETRAFESLSSITREGGIGGWSGDCSGDWSGGWSGD